MMMNDIKKILVPLDGSKNSKRGLEFAITLAKQCQAAITALYSISAPTHTGFHGMSSGQKNLKVEIEKILSEAAKSAEKNGVKFKERTMRGDVGYNIIKLAHGKDNYDMIVIGSRGRSTTKSLFFGSVSNYVIHSSKIPVVIVR